MSKEVEKKRAVTIPAPNFSEAVFKIKGVPGSPLVMHKFSTKTQIQMLQDMEAGKPAGSRKKREPLDVEAQYNSARYINRAGWDGINATGFRHGMVSMCRLVGFKMTLAKLSVFIVADGVDEERPQVPLVRIYGKPIMQEDMARTATGRAYVTLRPAYHDWYAKLKIRWDADQFTLEDMANLLARVGLQGGIGEGRNDSKMSAGMGWGMFEVCG